MIKKHIQVTVFSLLLTASVVAAAQRPNILFIMSDDHTAQSVGAYATVLKPLNPTPTLDKLAAEGMVFENAFCSNSICTPSRASIITGQYPHVNGVTDLTGRIKPADQTLPILFRKAGYQTAMIGKWHLKEEPNFNYYKVLPGQGKYFDTEFRVQGNKPWPRNVVTQKGEHSSDAITDSTLQWFKTMYDKDKPFFICHQFKAPHDYFENAPRYQEYLADVEIPEPETLWDDYSGRTSAAANQAMTIARHLSENDLKLNNGPNNLTPEQKKAWDAAYGAKNEAFRKANLQGEARVKWMYQRYIKDYLRCIASVDENVGRILDYLDASGLAKNTLVLYLGDNGFALGEHGFYDKRDAFEESIRIPMLAYAPGRIQPGTTVTQMALNLDVAQTILQGMDVAQPSGTPNMSGRSLLPLLHGQETAGWRGHFLYEYHWEWNFPATPTTLAIRTDRYKYVYYHGVWDKNGLYDLETDPHERHNLIRVPAFAERAGQLKEQLFAEPDEAGALTMPIRPPKGVQFYDRKLRR